ncbi:MAG: histidine phosphatase family protein [Clostridiaceae bacterium]|nr:histidine phosphatase family protein [Clostridiaceae bacterium]
MVRLYITRHGETVWNVQRRMQGQKNSELTDRGRQQAALLSKTLEDVEFETAYSSSSERALQTARIIVGNRNIPIVPLDSLREINFGEWEGRNAGDVEKEYPEQYRNFWEYPLLYEPVGGESFDDIINRFRAALELLADRHDKGNILVVTHAVALKTIALIVEKKELKDFWSGTFIHPASLSIIEHDGTGWKAVKWGDISHYEHERAE